MINIIGFPGCGTTSYYRYLVEKGEKVHYWDGWQFTERDKRYAGDIHLISIHNEMTIKEKNRKRKRKIVNFVQPNQRELFWRKKGAVIVYLEDMIKKPDFPQLNQFNSNTKKMIEGKRKEDKISNWLQS